MRRFALLLRWALLTGPLLASGTVAAGEGDAEPSSPNASPSEFDAAYRRLHTRAKPHRFRAALEDFVALAAGTTWYFIDDRNVLDWDNPSIQQRFNGEAWTYDNNGFAMNFVMHPFSGAAFYALPRGNDLSIGESFGYGFATSFLWEYVIEFKEKVSVNDLIMTPGGGLVLGEFFHKLAWRLNADPSPTNGQRALQWLFGPTVRMHRALDGEVATPRTAPDDIWAEFSVGYTATAASHTGGGEFPLHKTRFSGELVSIPGYLQPVALSRLFYRLDFTELEAAAEYSEAGGGFRMRTDTAVAGWYSQRLVKGPRGIQGTTVRLAAHTGYGYRRTEAGGFDERLGVFHFPGPGVESRVLLGPVATRFSLRAHPDFAGVSSPSFPQWEANHPEARPKSVLMKQSYYYGWGWSTRARGEVRVGPIEATGSFFGGAYASHEGLDRTQDKVTNDVECDTRLTMFRGGIGVRPPGNPIRVGVSGELRRWESTSGGVRVVDRVTAAGVEVVTRF